MREIPPASERLVEADAPATALAAELDGSSVFNELRGFKIRDREAAFVLFVLDCPDAQGRNETVAIVDCGDRHVRAAALELNGAACLDSKDFAHRDAPAGKVKDVWRRYCAGRVQ